MMRRLWVYALCLVACGCAKESGDGSDDGRDADRWEGQYAGECSDGADNDGDGLYDCDDTDCAGAPTCSDDELDADADATADDSVDTATDADDGGEEEREGDDPFECSDGADNDGNGLFDCEDPGCEGSPDCEDSDSDGISDDGSDSSDEDAPDLDPPDLDPPDLGPPDEGPSDVGPDDADVDDDSPDETPSDVGPDDADVDDDSPDETPSDVGPDDADVGPSDAAPPDEGPSDVGPDDADVGPSDVGPDDVDEGPSDAGPDDVDVGPSDTDVDVDGGSDAGLDADGASDEDATGAGEMTISGWITLSGDVDPTEATCMITTWPWEAISPSTGAPDMMLGIGMLGGEEIDCPLLDTPVPYSVVIPVEGSEVGVIAKVETDDRIYEFGCDSNPLMSVPSGDAMGFDFEIDVSEPGPGDPGGGTPLDAGDPLDEGPEAPPDFDGTADGPVDDPVDFD